MTISIPTGELQNIESLLQQIAQWLADEINRAAPETPSALLEAMAERHITVGGATHDLESPFFVVATQNPIEHRTHPTIQELLAAPNRSLAR